MPVERPATVARSALRAAKGVAAASFRSLMSPARARRWPSMADRAVLVLPRLAASSMAVSIWPNRRSRSATVWVPSSAARSLAAAARAAAWALMAAAVRGVLVLGASAALRVCDPSVPASPADCYGKRVAETENKAKKKLVSITTETSM